MDMVTACRILGIEATASKEEVASTKRKLLHAFHPDKHSPTQKEVFERMTKEIIEAAGILLKTAKSKKRKTANNSESTNLEKELYEKVNKKDYNGQAINSSEVVIYKKRYKNDNILAVAILSIDYGYTWHTRPLFGLADPISHSGSAVNLLVMNQTNKEVSGFYIGQECYLIDDAGYQYSPCDISFYWESSGEFNSYSDFLAPNSKVDGFILFPELRKGSQRFTKWLLRGDFKLDGKYRKGTYDIKLI